MRVAISGTANTGKTTLIKDFLARWGSYKTPSTSYRHIIEQHKDEHSSHTTEAVQEEILDFLIKTQSQYEPDDNVIFDRCTLDNLAYTLWGVHNGTITSEYADQVIAKVKESFRDIDIIFLIKYDHNIKIEDDGIRETNERYIKEIDAIFQLIFEDYLKSDENTFVLFPKDDLPAVIEIHGSREQRIAQIADYIDPFGDVVETAPEQSVLSQDQLNEMEAFIKLQKQLGLEEKFGIN